MSQRVLTREEYAALGYIEIGDLSSVKLQATPNKPLSTNFNFPVYRAKTQEQYLMDLGIGIVKVGYSVTTGGLSAAASTALGYTLSKLT